jgi:threonine/homoserine/homoserine lactone efflux protein
MADTGFVGFFIQGLLLGLSIAAPVGPIGVLCIRRSLQKGFKSGLASGLGAASADAVYGTIAAAGLTLAADFLAKQATWLGLLGGIFLVYLGVQTLRAAPLEAENEAVENKSLVSDFLSTFLLTLSNPITIFSFLTLFGGISVTSEVGFWLGATVLVMGVFIGSALWWLLLSWAVSASRKQFGPKEMRIINYSAAVVILGFAVLMLWRVANQLLS